MKQCVIIVAGGTGLRMQSAVPKQFLELHNKPILVHTIERFLEVDPNIHIIVALPESFFKIWHQISGQYAEQVTLSKGGSQRFFTVKTALEKVPDNVLVAVHDAVRPLVPTDTIRRAFSLAKKHGNAIPFVKPVDSIRFFNNENGAISINRNDVCLIQTPQTFLSKKLKKAYDQEYMPNFTDDASVWEASGEHVFLFEGDAGNIKITHPVDLIIAQSILQHRQLSKN